MKEKTTDGESTPPAAGGTEEKPRGRAAMMAAYKAMNEGAGDDVSDDDLYDWSLGRSSDLEGKWNDLAGANKRLAELTAADPRLAAVLTMISGEDPKSLPYAVARVYGKDFLSLEGEELDDFEKGYREQLAELSESKRAMDAANANIDEYRKNLDQYAKENGLNEEEVSGLDTAIYTDVINMLNGIIPTDFIDRKWKGMNYERDVQDAADAGVAEGSNRKIEARMRQLAETPPEGGVSPSASRKNVPVRPKDGSFWDKVTDV